MKLTVIQAPPFYPVTLEQVYKQCRLDAEGSPPTHPLDTLLTSYIAAATAEVEGKLHRSLVQRVLRMSAGDFPGDASVRGDRWPSPSVFRPQRWFELLMPPVVAVAAVEFYDGDNSLQTVDPVNYFLTDDDAPRLQFVDGFAAASVYCRDDCVRVTYTAGYAADGSPPTSQEDYAANLPPAVVIAVLIGVQKLYENLLLAELDAVERQQDTLLAPLVLPVLA